MRLSVFIKGLAAMVSLFLPVLNIRMSTGETETVSEFFLYRFTPVGLVLIPVIIVIFCAEAGILPEIMRKMLVAATVLFGIAGAVAALLETKWIIETASGAVVCWDWGIPVLLFCFLMLMSTAKDKA